MNTIDNIELVLLIETYSTQKDSALSNHQRALLSALRELQAVELLRRCVMEFAVHKAHCHTKRNTGAACTCGLYTSIRRAFNPGSAP